MIRIAIMAATTAFLAPPSVAFAQSSISNGQTIQAALSASDPTLDDGSHYRCYRLQTRAGERYRVEMKSEAFDAYLGVGKSCSEPEETDDDGAGGTDARIDFAGDGQAWLIRANSLSEGETGSFTVSVSRPAEVPALGPVNISFGQMLQGSLGAGDAVADDDSYYDCYVFTARRDERVVIDLQSSDFDAFAVLYQGGTCSGEGQESDDDGGGGTNARIEATLPTAGTWSVRANSLTSGEVGAYIVRLGSDVGGGDQAEGQTVAYFQASSDELTSETRARLDDAAAQVRSTGQVQVIVAGYADQAEGTPDYAIGLSQRRANRARDYLIQRGVPGGTVVTQAFGSTRPSVESTRAEPANRRVEITFGPGSGW